MVQMAWQCTTAAAELLQLWLEGQVDPASTNSSNSSGGEGLREVVAAAALKMQPLLLQGLDRDTSSSAHNSSSTVTGGGGSRRRSSGAVGGATAEMLGVPFTRVMHVLKLVGASGWANACKAAQQEPLLGLLLGLSCQVSVAGCMVTSLFLGPVLIGEAGPTT
jgi:hypothetical protein